MLIRGIRGLPESSKAMTSDGELFVDLPFLAHDFTRLCTLSAGSISYDQRKILHSFLATLVGRRVG